MEEVVSSRRKKDKSSILLARRVVFCEVRGMKYVGALFLFLAVFVVAGIAMHQALYERPGIFVWSVTENPDTGQKSFVRTTLDLVKVEAVTPAAPVSEKAPTQPKVDEPAPTGEKAATAAQVEVKATQTEASKKGEILLFDGKTLGKWKSTVFGGEGDTFVNENGELEFGFGAVITGVNWTGEPPATNNYEISLEAMKLDGNDFFVALTFPVKDSFGTLIVGGWGGGVVGISSVDDLSASENETMSIEGFSKDLWYKIRVRVTEEKIEAWINDEEKVSLELKDRKISLLPGDIELSVPIGIAAYQTRAKYKNIIWRNLEAVK